jgi:site-specific recombinase XerD
MREKRFTVKQMIGVLKQAQAGIFPRRESTWLVCLCRGAPGLKHHSGHCNRHTFASRLVMARVDMHTAGELLGPQDRTDDETLRTLERES